MKVKEAGGVRCRPDASNVQQTKWVDRHKTPTGNAPNTTAKRARGKLWKGVEPKAEMSTSRNTEIGIATLSFSEMAVLFVVTTGKWFALVIAFEFANRI